MRPLSRRCRYAADALARHLDAQIDYSVHASAIRDDAGVPRDEEDVDPFVSHRSRVSATMASGSMVRTSLPLLLRIDSMIIGPPLSPRGPGSRVGLRETIHDTTQPERPHPTPAASTADGYLADLPELLPALHQR